MSTTHTRCPSCGFYTPNTLTEYFCRNKLCIFAKERWNGGYIRLRNPTTGQTGSVVAFANIHSAYAKGFIHLEAPVSSIPSSHTTTVSKPTYTVVYSYRRLLPIAGGFWIVEY